MNGQIIADVVVKANFAGTTASATMYVPGAELVRKHADSQELEGIDISPAPYLWGLGTKPIYTRFRFWTGGWIVRVERYGPGSGSSDEFTVNGQGWMQGAARVSQYEVIGDLNNE